MRFLYFAAFLLLIAAVLTATFRRQLLDRLMGLSPTAPDEPDEREGHDDRPDSGADPEYGDDLKQLRHTERDLQAIAEEHDLDLLDPDQLAIAEEVLTLRLSVNELVDHFGERLSGLEAWLDGWAEGWDQPELIAEPHSFPAVRALVEGADKVPTGQYPLVKVSA